MRIKCFSEARGVFEEGQISFEPQMYCFGGGGGGGNSDTDQAIAEQEAYDAAGGSPSQNFSSGGGGGGNGNDGSGGGRVSYDVDEDAPVGRNSGSGGGGNGNDSSRQAIAARAGVPTDTIVGSGPKGSGVVTSAGGPVTSARGVTQAARDLGISEDEVRARINAAVTAAPGLSTGGSSAASAFDQAIAEQEAYDAAGTAIAEFDIFGPLELEDLQQGINMRQAEFDALSARYDGLAPLATFNIVPELNMQLDDLNSQLAGKLDEITGLQTRLDDTFKQFTDLQGVAPVASSAMTQDEVYNLVGGPGPVSTAPGPRPSANRFEGEVVPGFGASIDRAISDFMGEYYGGITEQLPDGTISKELFTDLGDFVSLPTKFLSGDSPVAQQRMQEGYKADYGIEIPNIEVFGQKIPISAVGAAVNALANPEYTMTQALRQGATPVYGTLPGQQGSILGATSPSGDIVYSNAPIGDSLAALKGTFGFGPGLDPNMKAAYARQQELDDAERARNDQAAPPALTLPDPVTQECPEGYTRDGSGVCVYQGRAMALNPFSASRGPRDFQYTGVGSLQPFILQPTPVRQADPVDPFALMRS
jgi:hypothetical protein